MKITQELYQKAKSAKSAEELAAFAAANQIEMTAENAKDYFALLHGGAALGDEELDSVAGGCGSDKPLGYVNIDSSNPVCVKCKKGSLVQIGMASSYDVFECSNCGHSYKHLFYGDLWVG